jgi:PAS domain S-box-containing protein
VKFTYKIKKQVIDELEVLSKKVKGIMHPGKELKENEEKFRVLLENLPQKIFFKDENSVYISCNGNYARDLGIRPEEIAGKTDYDFHPEYLAEKYKEDDKKIMLSEKTIEIEEKYIQDGKETIVETVKTPVMDEKGNIIGILGIFWDITVRKRIDAELTEYRNHLEDLVKKRTSGLKETNKQLRMEIAERKIAEKKLIKEQERFRLLVEKSPLGIAFIEPNGQYKYINSKFAELFGYTLEDISTGRKWFERAYPDKDYRKQVISTWIKDIEKLKKGEFQPRPFNVTCKDGSEKMIQFMPMTTEAGEQFVICEDITERKWAEEEIRKLTTAVEQSIDGIAIFDLNGRLTYANDAFAATHGYSSKEITGINITDLQSKEQINGQEDLINHLKTHGSWAGEVENTRKDGTIFSAYISVTLLKENEGSSKAILVSLIDITEQKMLEAQLNQAQKMEALGTIAGGIAHNFNNLLMGIMGNTSLMLLNTDPAHPNYERLKTIEKQVQSGSRLTNQLLGYAREGKYEIESVSLNRLVIETSNTFSATKKEIRVHIDLADDLLGINADQGQIEQILLNLYVNAADAMPIGGDLFLKTMNATHEDMRDKPYKINPGSYVLLTVRDTGMGMDKKTMEKIFDPFFTTKGFSKGTGLGLASVYGIVKSHGGYINVDSRKGKGSTFSIYLPASSKEVKKESEPSSMLYAGKETLLLVDDEDMILEVGARMLEALGYKILTAKGGKEAVKIYKSNKHKISLVILDMVMPDMGGGEVYDKIKKVNPDVKVLLSSGYDIEFQAAEILSLRCDSFIQKPFDIKTLSREIRKILDKKS